MVKYVYFTFHKWDLPYVCMSMYLWDLLCMGGLPYTDQQSTATSSVTGGSDIGTPRESSAERRV